MEGELISFLISIKASQKFLKLTPWNNKIPKEIIGNVKNAPIAYKYFFQSVLSQSGKQANKKQKYGRFSILLAKEKPANKKVRIKSKSFFSLINFSAKNNEIKKPDKA